MSKESLSRALEAILMVTENPVAVTDLALVLEEPTEEIDQLLQELRDDFAGRTGSRPRGFELREVAGGWRIYSAPEMAEVVGRFVVGGRTGRLTRAALETLAVVAYRQPITRGAIGAIRGVNVDTVVRTLLARELITEVGQEDNGALLYGTTPAFLEQLGLDSLADLPPLAPHLPATDELADLDQTLEGTNG